MQRIRHLLCAFAVLCALAVLCPSAEARIKIIKKDAYSSLRAQTGGGAGPSLTSVGKKPAGAQAKTLSVTATSEVFTWYSSTPNNQSTAENAYIILHGINRNAHTYFDILNKVLANASDAGLTGAGLNTTVSVAPLFFSAARDSAALNRTTLGWGDPSEWVGGDASTHPHGSDLSVFTVLDAMLQNFTDQKAYPAMKRVTFLAHGAGAQVLQRYAVLGEKSSSCKVAVRYVIGDPSSMLHFTRDRPEAVDTTSCSVYNDFRYGFSNYRSPYPLSTTPQGLFERYLARDVRYIIGGNDTREDKGDQLCAGRAMGGSSRSDRSLNYWAYLHLLSGSTKVPEYPGLYETLDPVKAKRCKIEGGCSTGSTSKGTRPVSTNAELAEFKTSVKLAHQFFVVPGAKHNASTILGSSQGQAAIFGS